MRIFMTLLSILLLSACSSHSINNYAENKPVINIKTFFDGKLEAHGVVKNRQGEVIRYFSASIDAYWKDGVGILDEEFLFNDGEVQKRVWKITENSEGQLIATANDVIGDHQMHTEGNALFLNYVLRLPYGDSTIDVSVDDKMFLVNENRIINESVFYKWGFEVGSVQLVIEKL